MVQGPAGLLRRWARAAAICAVLASAGAVPTRAQPAAPPGVEVADVPLVAWVAARLHALPDTLTTFAVDSARLRSFRRLAAALADQDWNRARGLVDVLDYQLVAIREGGRWFVVASDRSMTGRDPTIVINVSAAKDVVVTAPHVPSETGTGEQAVTLLRELAGRAAVVSGEHRCASRRFTACDGFTAVCGQDEAYRDSDPGHNVGTLFHAAHVILAEAWSGAVVVSLHGMRADTSGVRTSLIISNGTRAPDTSRQSAATRLRLALDPVASHPGAVVSCNLPADAVHQFRPLCGYTNVQGRHVNGSADACRGNLEVGTGRFIHLEQDWSVLGPYALGWLNVHEHPFSKAFIEALRSVVPSVGR
jgi:hypothetical protein